MDKNRLALLASVVILLVIGAALSRCSGGSEDVEGQERSLIKQPPKPRVVYPRDVNKRPRRTLAQAPKDTGKTAVEATADPIQRAMATPGGGTVFVEVNGIRHSELANALLRCRQAEATESLRAMKETLGVDPLEDVDRVAIHEDLIAVSGFFDELKIPEGVTPTGEYGDDAQLFTLPNPDKPDEGPMHLAKMGNGLLVLGEDEAEVRAAIDRAEGRADDLETLPPHIVRGSEIYGRFGPELLLQLLGEGGGADPLVKAARDIVTGGTVRVLVDDHLSLSLDLESRSPQEGEDLAKMLGGAIAGLRQQAKLDGVDEVAALLDEARVLPQNDGAFGIDLAVPGDVILDALDCPRPGAQTP